MEDRVTLAEAFGVLAGYGLGFWCGVAAGIATFIVEIILCKKGILFAGADRKLALAKQRGHMLTATRQGTRGHDDKSGIYRQLRIHSKRKAPY